MARKMGKKVFDIEWQKDGLEIKVPVKVHTEMDFEKGGDVMKFSAEYPEAGIREEGTDINAVRSAVLEKLDSWYSVKWELYLLITIEGGDNGYGCTKFQIEFEMEFYVVGTDSMGKIRHMRVPRPESLEMKDGKCGTRWAVEHPSEGWPKTFEKESGSYYRKPLTRSIVRATPENVAAADKFVAAMRALLEQMHTHFSPAKVESMLARAMHLLPAPAEKNG